VYHLLATRGIAAHLIMAYLLLNYGLFVTYTMCVYVV